MEGVEGEEGKPKVAEAEGGVRMMLCRIRLRAERCVSAITRTSTCICDDGCIHVLSGSSAFLRSFHGLSDPAPEGLPLQRHTSNLRPPVSIAVVTVLLPSI